MRPSLRPAAPSKVLRLLAEKYPTRAAVESRLIYLQGQLVLPKGVEHFMSDLHGEYAAFFHILNNCFISKRFRKIQEPSLNSLRLNCSFVACYS